MLDSLLALIVTIEDSFRHVVPETIPILINHVFHSDWNVRKVAVDVIYTLCTLMCDTLEPFIDQIVEVLNSCRFDKIKHVRDSATTALDTIKNKFGSEYLLRLNEVNNKKPIPTSIQL